ncbi:hypothetical protein C8R46DRAFT_1277494 [Mycena filopes]|nr:hypothetical protein C8R46DRAFT_1277494 [Mycena filopes]
MQPLRRWATPQSIHSWWSDSNPPGATISIHAFAKPLSRLMYHRQALGIIAENQDAPLSAETVEILTSYLTYKEISPATRLLVLEHLSLRAGKSEEDAGAIIDGNALGCTLDLLSWPANPEFVSPACTMFENIVQYRSLVASVAALSNRLASLLSHANYRVRIMVVDVRVDAGMVESLMHDLMFQDVHIQSFVLSRLCMRAAKNEQDARSLVDAKPFACILDLLQSPDQGILKLTCSLLGAIARHQSLRTVLVEADDTQLVTLLKHTDVQVQTRVIEALDCMDRLEILTDQL